MLVKLVGVHKVKAKLAGGKTAIYYYAWRGGPRIKAEPHTREFQLEFARLTRDRELPNTKGTVAELIREYLKSPDYQKLKPSTKNSYDWAINQIHVEFQRMPINVLGGKGTRRGILDWRDTYADRPRAADLLMAVFSKVIAFAVDRELIERHPLEKVGKLANSTRRDFLWSDADVETFRAKAPERMVLAMELARWTGQRQGDLLALTWSAYDCTHIKLTQGKTGSRVRIKVAAELKALLDAEKDRRDSRKAPAVTILTNRSGRPYLTGFRSSWQKAMKVAGIKGLTFHDLRGTFVTLAYREGSSFKEIAEVSGHSETEAEAIIRRHYLAGDSAVTRLENRNKKGQDS
jgi:integrase